MINRFDIQGMLLDLAKRIADSDRNAAKRLSMLAQAINGDKYTRAWAQFDIFKMIDPETTAEQLNGTRKDIQKFRSDLVHALAEASLLLYDEQSQLITPAAHLDDVAQHIRTTAIEATKQLDNMAQNIYSTFEQIAREMTEQIQKSNRYFEQLGNFVSGLIQLSTEMEEATSTLQKGNQDLATSIKSMVRPLAELSTQQQALVTETHEANMELRSVAKELEALVKVQMLEREALSNALKEMTVAFRLTDELIAGFKDFTVQQSSVLEGLEEERKAQSELAKVVSGTAEVVGHALTDINHSVDMLGNVPDDMKISAIELHSLVENMRELHRIQSTLPESMGEIIQSYSHTAEAIERSTRALDESVMALYRASHEFTGQPLADISKIVVDFQNAINVVRTALDMNRHQINQILTSIITEFRDMRTALDMSNKEQLKASQMLVTVIAQLGSSLASRNQP